MKYLDNLKITAKVAIISGSILVLLLVSSGIAVWGLTTADAASAEYRRFTARTNAAATAQAELLAASLGVKDFLISGSDTAARTVSERVANADAAIATLLDLNADEKMQAVAQASAQDIAAYNEAFQALLPLRDERDRLVDVMVGAGQAAERLGVVIMDRARESGNNQAIYFASQSLSNLMVAQLYATRFLVENELEQVDLVLGEMARLQDNLQKLSAIVFASKLQKDAAQLWGLGVEYQKAFTEVSWSGSRPSARRLPPRPGTRSPSASAPASLPWSSAWRSRWSSAAASRGRSAP